MFVTDFIQNGAGVGEVGRVFQDVRFDPGLLRPYLKYEEGHNVRYVTVNSGRKWHNPHTKRDEFIYVEKKIEDLERQGIYSPVANATSLRKEDWIRFDKALTRVARARLMAFNDLASKSRIGGFDAMAAMTLEYEAMSDPGFAKVSMDGLSEDDSDMPLFSLRSTPLPITHSGFYLSKRQLMQSQRSGMPLSTALLEACTRRVAESVEKRLIGIQSGPSYGYQSGSNYAAHESTIGSQEWGYLTYPYRLTSTSLTTPTGLNPNSTLSDFITLRESLYAQNFYGPFQVYLSTDWDQYMDNDYVFTNGTGYAVNPTQTLRSRLNMIEGISGIKRLDYLTAADSHAFTVIMAQQDSECMAAIDGMQPTLVQWESKGGMQLNFKVMAILSQVFKSTYTNQCGLMHARTA